MILRILHTNDVHSRFEDFAKVVTKIKELRNENTIVLDAGDFNDFMRLELQGTEGRAGVELLDIAGYDAIAIGNNEGFQGLKAAETLATAGKTPFLSCNVYKFEEDNKKLFPIKGVKRSIILEKQGVRFLIIGGSPFGGYYNEFFELSNMYSTDGYEEIQKEIRANEGKYDICILLSHCGMRENKIIAEEYRNVDIIIGGHTHLLMEEPLKINNTIINMAGDYAQHLGFMEFEIEDKKIISYRGENIKTIYLEQDKDIMRSLKANKIKAIENMSIPLYEIGADLWHDVVEENPISNALADILKDVLQCDIGLINSGVLNGGIRKGPVSEKKLLEICPSPLNPTYMEIQGKDIKKALKKSLYSDICMQDGKGAGFRGKYLGKLHVSGLTIEHDGIRLIRVLMGNEELEDDKWYSVATSDYLQRGTGYASLSSNRNERYNAEYLRDSLREYLKREEYIKKAFVDRWIKK